MTKPALDLLDQDEAAERLRWSSRGFRDWINAHPVDASGSPFYVPKGNRKLFTERDLERILAARTGDSRPEPRQDTFIYFLGMAGHIKIGQSKLWQQRLSNLQVASPFDITPLLVMIALPRREDELHRKFAKQRVRGEWFKDCPEIRDYIATKKSQCVLAHAGFLGAAP